MRIAVGGIMHESNTFLPLTTGLAEFSAGSLTRGQDLIDTWCEAHHEMGGFLEALASAAQLAPSTMAWATPSGPVDDRVLDDVVPEIIAGCQEQQVDGLLLALHGAMVTPKHPDADTEVLRRLRKGLGEKMPIIVSLDFHGNITPELAGLAQALVGYQTYPHIDQRQRGRLAGELMLRTLRGEIRPVCAVAKPPLILNLLGQDTGREPMLSLMKEARALEQEPGMLSLSVMAGFPYADVPAMGPSIIAVADGDKSRAERAAERLAGLMWDVRHQLNVECPQPAEAVAQALKSERFPVVLVDLGDNVGGGSAADGTVLLAEMIKQRAAGVVALCAPAAVKRAFELGVGGNFEGRVGGAVDDRHGAPVAIRGKVTKLHDGKWVETEARHGGRRHNDQGPTAIIEIDGPIKVVVDTLRTPPFSLGQLTSLGIEPAREKILVVKAAVAYKAAYLPIAGKVIEVDTPGLTAINPAHFEYKRIRRPMFPLDEEAKR